MLADWPSGIPHNNRRQAQPVVVRIKARCIIDANGCWLWQGKTVRGYGRIKVGSHSDGTQRNAAVHRVTYEELVGPIPEGLTIDHLCNQPACCNPEHLRPATLWENTSRSDSSPAAVNARKKVCSKCGGPFTVKANGHRYCRPCALAYLRVYNATRRRAVSS